MAGHDHAGIAVRTAGTDLPLLDQGDPATLLGQVVGRADPHRPSANHQDIRFFRHCHNLTGNGFLRHLTAGKWHDRRVWKSADSQGVRRSNTL